MRVTSTAICGSDLHIYQGAIPANKDYVIGHEPMGIVEEVGPEVTKVKKKEIVLYYLSMYRVGIAITVTTIWKVNVIIRTPI